MKLRIYYLLLVFFIPFINGCHTTQSGQRSNRHTLRVMTYNIHHANPPSKAGVIDLQAIARVINNAKPDLVALQEIDVHTERSGEEVDEARELAKLTGMHFHFTRSLDYQGGEYGIAVLSRFPLIDEASFHLPVEEGSKEEVRSICMIKIKIPGGDTVFFASTHLGLSRATRLLQVKRMIRIVDSLPHPLIIGGDFNARPESESIQLLDHVLTRSCKEQCAFTIPAEDPSHKIDYIMYSPANKFNVLDQKVIPETYASDHLPVLVTFGF